MAKQTTEAKTGTPAPTPVRKLAVRVLDKIETTGLTGGDN